MRKTATFAALALVVLATVTLAQSKRRIGSLCALERSATQGSKQAVVVSGVFIEGLDSGVLTDPSCPTHQGTWAELALHSERNKDKLRRLLEQSRQAAVVFAGDFYGPPTPDPKLPESIRKNYHPGWGHMAAFPTKLVVREIHSVSRVAP